MTALSERMNCAAHNVFLTAALDNDDLQRIDANFNSAEFDSYLPSVVVEHFAHFLRARVQVGDISHLQNKIGKLNSSCQD